MITLEQLKECVPKARSERLEMLLPGIQECFDTFDISTPERQAMFLAQTAHESGNFAFLEENLNYRAASLGKVWPKKFPPGVAEQYGGNPQKIANRAYADRMGNGPESSGDGWAYRGRGLIQLTGKDNYRACGKALGFDLVADPDLVTQSPFVVLSAGWFWDTRKLNQWADQKDVLTVTKKINGGTLGLEDRKQHFEHMLHVLSGE